MKFLQENCFLSLLSQGVLENSNIFSCGDADLDDFFQNDTAKFNAQLLGKSYCYRLDNDDKTIVCAFTLSNASIDVRNLPNSRKKKLITDIPREKHISSYPAMLIGRLGVNKDFGRKGIGTELLDTIKMIALDEANWASCRFVTVDAYNNESALKYYENNGFLYLFSTEEQEKEFIGLSENSELKTRIMYFDLITAKF